MINRTERENHNDIRLSIMPKIMDRCAVESPWRRNHGNPSGHFNFVHTYKLTNSTAQPGLNLIPRNLVLLQTTDRTHRSDNEVFRSFTFNLRMGGCVQAG